MNPDSPLRQLNYQEVSDAVDRTDISTLLDKQPPANTPAPVQQDAVTRPVVVNTQLPDAHDPLYLARVLDIQRQQEMAATGRHIPDWARPTPPPQQPTAVPTWVWKYSAIAISSGIFTGLAGWGVGQTAAWAPYLEDLAYAVASVIVAGTAALTVAGAIVSKILSGIRARLERPHITVTHNVTTRGFLARGNSSSYFDNRRR